MDFLYHHHHHHYHPYKVQHFVHMVNNNGAFVEYGIQVDDFFFFFFLWLVLVRILGVMFLVMRIVLVKIVWWIDVGVGFLLST